jgi:hypothetical protein
LHDPNAGIGGSYAFTWRGFAALVPKRDYDEVHRYLRHRSKREGLKMGEVAVAAAAARSTRCATAPPPRSSTRTSCATSRTCYASGYALPDTEPTSHGSADPDTRH